MVVPEISLHRNIFYVETLDRDDPNPIEYLLLELHISKGTNNILI
jgi:hypothetical protein